MLDLAKIEAGEMTCFPVALDLYALLELIQQMLTLKANSKGLLLNFELSEALPRYIQADDKKLRQALINLIGNAIKFTTTGSVTVRVGLDPNSAPADPGQPFIPLKGRLTVEGVLVHAERAPEHSLSLMFEIEDTGVGIAPEEMDRLFDAFVQTDAGKKSQQGTGLGLPLTQRFVELMGGTLAVESQVGQGSRFRFTLPVGLTDASQVKTQESLPVVIGLAPEQQEFRILVVDDRWENRRVLCQLLQPIGFAVKEAGNGQEAIALWETWQPHLIWMDMRMPIMNGYEATQFIKANLQGQATVIIALTASTLETEKAIVLSAGCDDFVRKPFREEEIFVKMAQTLGVKYLYEVTAPEGEVSSGQAQPLTAMALTVMPRTWLADLAEAAALINETLIAQLVSQIPLEHHDLALTIQTEVKNFDYDRIMTLAQEAMNYAQS